MTGHLRSLECPTAVEAQLRYSVYHDQKLPQPSVYFQLVISVQRIKFHTSLPVSSSSCVYPVRPCLSKSALQAKHRLHRQGYAHLMMTMRSMPQEISHRPASLTRFSERSLQVVELNSGLILDLFRFMISILAKVRLACSSFCKYTTARLPATGLTG